MKKEKRVTTWLQRYEDVGRKEGVGMKKGFFSPHEAHADSQRNHRMQHTYYASRYCAAVIPHQMGQTSGTAHSTSARRPSGVATP